MIIDAHTHIGTTSFPVGKNRVSNLKEEKLLLALHKYQIDFALVSNIEGAEFNSDSCLGRTDEQIPQISVMEKTIDLARRCPNRLKALLWIKPFTEGYSDQIEQLIKRNTEFIAGFKIHPSLSDLPLTDEKYHPYLKLASKLQLPVQIHSEDDGRSNVRFVYDMALMYPRIPFIMVHMGFNSDNADAIDLMQKTDNLYGDTCEVKRKSVIKAIEVAGSEKLLFGTDAIVNGMDTYKKYVPIIKAIQQEFPGQQADNVLGENCVRLYKLETAKWAYYERQV